MNVFCDLDLPEHRRKLFRPSIKRGAVEYLLQSHFESIYNYAYGEFGFIAKIILSFVKLGECQKCTKTNGQSLSLDLGFSYCELHMYLAEQHDQLTWLKITEEN